MSTHTQPASQPTADTTGGQFDVIVIGAGPAGEVAAGRCAEAGLSVAIVERELVGGECSYWGCIPSKVLLRPGDVLAAARRVPGAAAAVTGGVDAEATFRSRDSFTGNWDDTGSTPWLTERGITIVRGVGRLTGEGTVAVAADGPPITLTARRAVVIATGTRAAIPPIPGLVEAAPWDNRDVTAAHAVPARLVVIGGGPIGLEMAQAFRRLGSREVIVLEVAPRLFAREEPYVADEVREALTAEGLDIRTGVAIVGVSRDPGDRSITVELDGGERIVADEILVAAGRRPATGDLGLDVVGLEPGRAIDVDDQLRARGVEGGWLFAVGDCNGRALLTHMGKYQARVAADVILGRDGKATVASSDRAAVPRVTFTDPQVAAVGLTEAQAHDAGLAVRVVQHATGGVAGAAVLGKHYPGTSQLVIDERRGVIVGATFVGPNVQELLHAATIAIVGEVPLDRLWHAVPAFPTVSEVWLRLLEAYGL